MWFLIGWYFFYGGLQVNQYKKSFWAINLSENLLIIKLKHKKWMFFVHHYKKNIFLLSMEITRETSLISSHFMHNCFFNLQNELILYSLTSFSVSAAFTLYHTFDLGKLFLFSKNRFLPAWKINIFIWILNIWYFYLKGRT